MAYPMVQLPQWRSHLPEAVAKQELIADVRAWVTSEPLTNLVSTWGTYIPENTDLNVLLPWLDEFSEKYWNFRAGRERNLVEKPSLTKTQEESTVPAARALGLMKSRPPRHHSYDAILVLGGLVRACFVRPRYAAELLKSDVHSNTVVGLGGFRPLAGDELDLAKHFGVKVLDEMHAMVEGIRQAFNIPFKPLYENDGKVGGNADWEVARFPTNSSSVENLSVIAAPSSQPEQRRANSVDTYLWWAKNFRLARKARVLMITTTIYVPYQGAGAIQALSLRYGADVETIGVPARLADLGEQTQKFLPHHYLQELRSAIRGYRSLVDALG